MTLKGKGPLEARLKAIGDTRGLLKTIQIHGVAEAKALVPRRTGNLGRTIRVGRLSKTSASIVAGGARNVGYAAAVERGTRPHIIRPRKAKSLAWGGERTLGGRLRSGQRPTHFARLVRHPGTKAKPYLVPGLKKAAQKHGVKGITTRWNGAA